CKRATYQSPCSLHRGTRLVLLPVERRRVRLEALRRRRRMVPYLRTAPMMTMTERLAAIAITIATTIQVPATIFTQHTTCGTRVRITFACSMAANTLIL